MSQAERIRAAIERAIHTAIAADNGDWLVELEDGEEIQFRPAGEFSVLVEDENGEEVEHTFRVRVERVVQFPQ